MQNNLPALRAPQRTAVILEAGGQVVVNTAPEARVDQRPRGRSVGDSRRPRAGPQERDLAWSGLRPPRCPTAALLDVYSARDVCSSRIL
jgi:hypothetical protein